MQNQPKINWDKPQILNLDGLLVLTNGKHEYGAFQGVSIGSDGADAIGNARLWSTNCPNTTKVEGFVWSHILREFGGNTSDLPNFEAIASFERLKSLEESLEILSPKNVKCYSINGGVQTLIPSEILMDKVSEYFWNEIYNETVRLTKLIQNGNTA